MRDSQMYMIIGSIIIGMSIISTVLFSKVMLFLLGATHLIMSIAMRINENNLERVERHLNNIKFGSSIEHLSAIILNTASKRKRKRKK